MGHKLYPLMKRVVATSALMAGVSGVANADDSSMNPFTGESFNYFNGGYDRSQSANPAVDQSPSEWRQTHPEGVPERVFQSYSAPGLAWKLDKPVFSSAPADPSFAQTHPDGLSDREYRALSSGAPAWQPDNAASATSVAAEKQAPVAQTQSSGQPLANFVHGAPTSSMQ